MLHDWTSLFTVTGAAGAQLIGLLFVVATLGTGLSTSQSMDGVRAFVTPTLVTFGGVLFVAVVALAPWPDWQIGLVLVLGGLGGLGYRINALHLKRKVDFAALHRLGWIPYDGIPMLGDTGLILGGAGLIAEKAFAPSALAAASALLLLAGIYGAWDLTLWMIKNRDKA